MCLGRAGTRNPSPRDLLLNRKDAAIQSYKIISIVQNLHHKKYRRKGRAYSKLFWAKASLKRAKRTLANYCSTNVSSILLFIGTF